MSHTSEKECRLISAKFLVPDSWIFFDRAPFFIDYGKSKVGTGAPHRATPSRKIFLLDGLR